MPQGQFVMILIVEHVDEVAIERMNLFDLGEGLQNGGKLVVDALFAELDFAHVERADSTDVIAGVHHRRGLTLRLRQNDIDEVLGGRDGSDALEVVVHDC